ncbi:MAG: DUF4912 domain-containing protein [Nitrospinota bacterium]
MKKNALLLEAKSMGIHLSPSLTQAKILEAIKKAKASKKKRLLNRKKKVTASSDTVKSQSASSQDEAPVRGAVSKGKGVSRKKETDKLEKSVQRQSVSSKDKAPVRGAVSKGKGVSRKKQTDKFEKSVKSQSASSKDKAPVRGAVGKGKAVVRKRQTDKLEKSVSRKKATLKSEEDKSKKSISRKRVTLSLEESPTRSVERKQGSKILADSKKSRKVSRKDLTPELNIDQSQEKFYVGKGGKSYDDDQGYQVAYPNFESKLIALVQNEYMIFFYWDLKESEVARVKDSMTTDSSYLEFTLRIYNAYDPKSYFDRPIDFDREEAYISINSEPREYIGALGFKDENGLFKAVANSNKVQLPALSKPFNETDKLAATLYDMTISQSDMISSITRTSSNEIIRLASGISNIESITAEEVGEQLRVGSEINIEGKLSSTTVLTINGEPIKFQEGDMFKLKLHLADGANELQINTLPSSGIKSHTVKVARISSDPK